MIHVQNNHFFSLEMREKHPRSTNGTTIIQYFVTDNISYSFGKIVKEHFMNTLPQFFNLEKHCKINDPLKVHLEGQFFVKSSSYKNQQELLIASEIARHDNIRFHLFHNKINTSTCPQLLQYAYNLNMSYDKFYHSFVTEGKRIDELILLNSSLPSLLKDIKNEELETMIKIRGNNPLIDTLATITTRLSNSFETFFEKNANIFFQPTENQTSANLIITPTQSNESYASEFKLFSNNKIEQMILLIPIPQPNSSKIMINEHTHALGHIFLDHNCENYYSCTKEAIQAQTPNLKYLSIMSQLATFSIVSPNPSELQPIQSLLPWDIAALRHSYGMPTPENVTYSLNNQQALDNTFATKLLNNSLVCFSSIGYNTIDVGQVKSYEIDFNYDHLSNITNQNISFQFMLSYDTKISDIMLYTPGRLILNKNESVNIFIYTAEANVCTSSSTEFLHKNIDLIQIGNFNETIHNINYSCLF